MNARDKDFGIDFDYLAGLPTATLINEVAALMEVADPGRGLKKHRADALRAELEGRADFQRPRTAKEAKVIEWLTSQIERRELD